MHEASLMRGLMRKLKDMADVEGAKRIVGVSVWIGALSHMSAAHFAEHFSEAAAGTAAEGAHLAITVSDDTNHPQAQDIILRSVEVEK